MSANVGTIDRLLRVLAGAFLIALPFVFASPQLGDPVVQFGAIAVGAVLVLTGLLRFCPLYRVLGLQTCRVS